MEDQITASWDQVWQRLDSWVDALLTNLPNIVMALIIFVAFYWLGMKLQTWLKRPVRRLTRQQSVQNLIIRFASLMVAAIGFLLALGILNLDTVLKSILAGAGVIGLAVGLALQGTLSNTFSGILLAVKDVINIGDWIESNGYAGKVEKIALRNTWVREADNNIVVIPNKDVLESPFKNYGLTDRIRVILECGVGYEEDLESVRDIAIEAVRKAFHKDVEEEVEFYYREFGGSSINFMMRFWVDAIDKMTILSAHSESIIVLKKAFDAADINIPFPIRTLDIKSDNVEIVKELVTSNNLDEQSVHVNN